MVFRLVGRGLGETFEEPVVCAVEAFQRELEGLATYLFEPGQILLQGRKFFGVVVVVEVGLGRQVSVFPFGQEVVVEVSARSEVFCEERPLLCRWVESEPIRVVELLYTGVHYSIR